MSDGESMIVTWRRESLWLTGGFIVALVCMYFWTHQTTHTADAAPVTVAAPAPALPSAVDWAKCLDTTAVPNNELQNYTVTVYNKCTVTMNPFLVRFKLYDSSDARIGWSQEGVSILLPSERVKWRMEYPIKDYPLTKDGVSKIVVHSYEKETDQ
jgi:hypothetical protein